MARTRRTSTTEATTQTDTTQEVRKVASAFTPLSNEQLIELRGKTRVKGLYEEAIREFLGAEVEAVQINTDEGSPFQGKKAQTLVGSFNAARKKLMAESDIQAEAKTVQVMQDGENVYLSIRQAVDAEAA